MIIYKKWKGRCPFVERWQVPSLPFLFIKKYLQHSISIFSAISAHENSFINYYTIIYYYNDSFLNK